MLQRYFSLESRLNLLLYLGFLIVILLMATSLYIMTNSNASIKRLSQELHTKQFNQTVNLLKLEQNLTLSFSQLGAFLITGHQEDEDKFDQAMDKVGQRFLESFDELYQFDKKIAEIIKQLDEYNDKARELISLSKNRKKNYIGIARAAELLSPLYLKSLGTMEQLIEDELNKEDEINLKVLSALVKTRSSWYRMIMSLRVYFTTLGKGDYQQFQLYLEQNKKDIKQLSALKDELGFDAVFISELEAYHSKYLNYLPEVLTIFKDDKWRSDVFLLKTEVYPLMAELLGQIKAVAENSENLTSKNISVMQSKINTQVKLSEWIFVISIILGISIVLLVGRNVSEIAQSLANSQHEASQNLIKANDRAQELEMTSNELQNSINLLNDAQEQLVETEKMAALGGLVAGIAHEINTPIGISLTSSSFLNDELRMLKHHHEAEKLTEEGFIQFINDSSESTSIITENLKRAATLINSFKQIAVDQSSEELRTFNLDAYLNEIIISLKPKLKNIDINILCAKEIELSSYPGVFSQIITNLIINSITHGFENIEQGKIVIQVAQGRNHKGKKSITIDYSDNGSGMTETVRRKIFEPFYTTKRNSGGSGIGMSLVYNLITQKLRGKLSVESEPGKGVMFKMVVPMDTETVVRG